jgi:hypothetical protein
MDRRRQAALVKVQRDAQLDGIFPDTSGLIDLFSNPDWQRGIRLLCHAFQ